MDDERADRRMPGDGWDDRFGRIERIYHQALERREEERLAFLAQAGSDLMLVENFR